MNYLTDKERSETFEYRSTISTEFSISGRVDLSGDVIIKYRSSIDIPAYSAFMMEFTHWWLNTYYERLNGFSGFDTVKFKIQDTFLFTT